MSESAKGEGSINRPGDSTHGLHRLRNGALALLNQIQMCTHLRDVGLDAFSQFDTGFS